MFSLKKKKINILDTFPLLNVLAAGDTRDKEQPGRGFDILRNSLFMV